MATFKKPALLTERDLNIIRGKASVGKATPQEILSVFGHYDLIEMRMEELDSEDFFGTEGGDTSSDCRTLIDGGLMTDSFNRLTPAEIERLALLAEECGEVVQAVAKILRHGYDNRWLRDHNRRSNRETLIVELGDVVNAINLCVEAGDVDRLSINFWAKQKHETPLQYLHHQDEVAK